jgi:hypothetical protein
VERDRELHDAKSGADVAPRARTDVDQASAHVVGERAKLIRTHSAQIGWRLNSIEN